MQQTLDRFAKITIFFFSKHATREKPLRIDGECLCKFLYIRRNNLYAFKFHVDVKTLAVDLQTTATVIPLLRGANASTHPRTIKVDFLENDGSRVKLLSDTRGLFFHAESPGCTIYYRTSSTPAFQQLARPIRSCDSFQSSLLFLLLSALPPREYLPT